MGGAYVAHFGRRGDYATLKITQMARSRHVWAIQILRLGPLMRRKIRNPVIKSRNVRENQLDMVVVLGFKSVQ